MSKIFETVVTKIGPEATTMIAEANMFILFGEGAPKDLADYCFTHTSKEVTGVIQAGGYLLVDGYEFLITSVGNLVYQNLVNLGHITVSLDGATESDLPGTLHIQAPSAPNIKLNSVIEIYE